MNEQVSAKPGAQQLSLFPIWRPVPPHKCSRSCICLQWLLWEFRQCSPKTFWKALRYKTHGGKVGKGLSLCEDIFGGIEVISSRKVSVAERKTYTVYPPVVKTRTRKRSTPKKEVRVDARAVEDHAVETTGTV